MTERQRLVEAVRNTLFEEMARDDSVVVYGQDVGRNGGVFRATQGLIDEYPNRVYDAPVAEAGIVGLGVGLGTYGFTPVPEIEFSGFMHQAFHQIQQHVARLRSRTRGELNCPMTIRAPYGGGIRALEHHSESFEAGYAHTPGLKVVVPSTPADAKGLLTSSIRDPDPVVFFEPTRLYRAFREEVPEGDYTVPLGEADVVREGEDVTVVAWGAMRHRAFDAAESVDASVEVVDPRSIVPFDTETVLESVRKTGRCVVVHEAPKTGGMAAEITARINDRALYYLEAPVQRVTGYDVPYPLFAREDEYVPDESRIRRGIERSLSG
ncbi:alpha-ketoacid dehydrogenase subunit beta [Haloprofundus salinisoli]|uniref:alpha-ketoacid dehydrogenase subunit beta n=1 Tax=Haloprofundus salinisoli TaxID=2876193 RepID=UPI001CCFECCB|nr:alpha-ketoacid dehydrogenase subunit beta [Haloprofundus salinisoli]